MDRYTKMLHRAAYYMHAGDIVEAAKAMAWVRANRPLYRPSISLF